MLNFYDFEVFKCDWLVVVINPVDHSERVIVNDPDALAALYAERKSQIWVGYNNLHYDQWIFKGILLGMDPKAINDTIIVDGKKGWQYSLALFEIPMINYDVHKRVDRGLKTLEAYMGNDIEETSVPFDIDRKLTQAEIDMTVHYCRHDVEQTIDVFMRRKSDFDARMDLLKMFKLPLSDLGKTDAQLTAQVLGAHRPKRERADEFDLELLPCIKLGKYEFARTWYLDPANRDYTQSFTFDIAGCPHICAWGGIHGALTQYRADGFFINVDVESYYPSEMITHNFLSRNVADPKRFEWIRDHRLELKHAGDNRQKALKLVINTTYGASKDRYNALYDARQANQVCVNGQLMLIDLMDKLVRFANAEIIQSNTDGVLVKMPDGGDPNAFYDKVDDIAFDWEQRTGMRLEFDEYTRVFQKDVNNYLLVAADGHAKGKGAYVKDLTDLDRDLEVVNRALVEYMLRGTPVENTINACDELMQFQRVVKVSSKYKYGLHGQKRLTDTCFRVFASTRDSDGAICRVKRDGANPERFANTSEHSFIDNGDIHGKRCPEYLDKQWYVDLAKTRLTQFGEEV